MEIDKIIKREVVSLVVSIILILLIFIGVSFASFFSVAEGNNNTISFGDIELTFLDNGEGYGQVIGLVEENDVSVPQDIYPYASNSLAINDITPFIFNLSNTGDLKLNVNMYLNEDSDYLPMNNFSNYNLTTELYSNNIKIGINECANGVIDRNNVTVMSYGSLTDNEIMSDLVLDVGEDITYCLWVWLDENTPNSVQSTYFVAFLSADGEYVPESATPGGEPQSNRTLKNTILGNIISNSDSEIDFGVGTTGVVGTGLYNRIEDEDNDGVLHTIHYFRGQVENNYVYFANYCWRVIRTNEDGSVRIRLGGTPTIAGESITCPATGSSTGISIGSSSWSSSANDNAYTGYMFGTPAGTSFDVTHSNSTDSNVKTLLDTWYNTNLSSYNNYIANAIYCNDRTPGTGDTPETIDGIAYSSAADSLGTNNTIYDVARRLSTGGRSNSEYNTSLNAYSAYPTFKCSEERDQFTLNALNGGSAGFGNNKLTYPIGLITADEVVFAGGEHGIDTTSYLDAGISYWTMSPMRIASSNSGHYSVNTSASTIQLNSMYQTSSNNIIPVISLNNNARVLSGNGEVNNPYRIETIIE